jgi:hypothetical protein
MMKDYGFVKVGEMLCYDEQLREVSYSGESCWDGGGLGCEV